MRQRVLMKGRVDNPPNTPRKRALEEEVINWFLLLLVKNTSDITSNVPPFQKIISFETLMSLNHARNECFKDSSIKFTIIVYPWWLFYKGKDREIPFFKGIKFQFSRGRTYFFSNFWNFVIFIKIEVLMLFGSPWNDTDGSNEVWLKQVYVFYFYGKSSLFIFLYGKVSPW